MRKFKFRLQSVLTVREAIEQKLLEELSNTQRRLESEKRALAVMQSRRCAALSSAASKRQDRPDPARERLAGGYIHALDKDISNQRAIIRQAESLVAAKLAEVMKAMQDRKSLENIKEKYREAHRNLELKEEMKTLDDFASIRSSRASRA